MFSGRQPSSPYTHYRVFGIRNEFRASAVQIRRLQTTPTSDISFSDKGLVSGGEIGDHAG
jgi:hypothetical protein